MGTPLSQRIIDPWYHEYVVEHNDPVWIDRCIATTVATFRRHGYRTAIITEAQGSYFLVSCIAVTQDKPQLLSEAASHKLRDHHQLTQWASASTEPSSLAFPPPRSRGGTKGN